MRITLMKSKLHRATVTQADLHYEGSIAIDSELCEAAHFYRNERVEIYNVSNGSRFATYVIYGKKGQICVNGAAARLVSPGDSIIIVSYGEFEEAEALQYEPRVVLLDQENRIKKVANRSGHVPLPDGNFEERLP
ncbi:MAG: aspartate 1-decarboxylase [Methylotenera sp.]|nr:aspartate 1-decarboxylase [Oligoflexia bacterium]